MGATIELTDELTVRAERDANLLFGGDVQALGNAAVESYLGMLDALRLQSGLADVIGRAAADPPGSDAVLSEFIASSGLGREQIAVMAASLTQVAQLVPDSDQLAAVAQSVTRIARRIR